MKEKETTKRRILEGTVVGNKMQGTVKVLVEYTKSHPKYKKVISRRKTFFAHSDEKIEEGVKVKIKESRPFSKNVKWIVIK